MGGDRFAHRLGGSARLAQERLMLLEKMADRDGDDPMYLKAFLMRITLYEKLEKQPDSIAVAQLQAAIKAHKQAGRQAVLRMALARQWSRYFSKSYYRILQRKQLEETPDDFREWDFFTFQDQILAQYEAAMAPASSLSKIPGMRYAPILDTVDQGSIFRPTLYDLIAHSVLDYFEQREFGLSRERIQAQLSPEQLLVPRTEFVGMSFGGDTAIWQRSLLLIQAICDSETTRENPILWCMQT